MPRRGVPASTSSTDPSADHGQAGPYGAVGRSAWLDVDWSEHLRWVTVAGRPVNVCEIGPAEGEAIVWIHGLAGCWQNWLENLPVLAEAGYRCVALDLPGFGRSPRPTDRITITRYADIVDELLGALGIEAACVIGNSMGGFIAAELAIAHPHRVERLVLVSAAGIAIENDRIGDRIGGLRRAEFAINAYGGWIASRSDRVARRARLRQAAFRVVAAHPEQLPAPLVAESLRGSGTPGFLDALEALTTFPISKRLPEIACPTLIVWGDEDRLVPVRDADEFEQLIPDSRKIIYPGTGHVAMIERPVAFNRLIEGFLDEEPNADVV